MATSDTPNRIPGGGTQHVAVVLLGRAHPRPEDQEGAGADQDGLEADQPRRGKLGLRAMGGREREAEQHQPGGGQREADPLPAAEPAAQHLLGHDRQHHHAAGQHGLDDREWGDRHGRDVEDPRAGADHPADREQRRGEQGLGRLPRPAHVNRGCRAGSPVLVQEADVSRQSAEEREEDAEKGAHCWVAGVRSVLASHPSSAKRAEGLSVAVGLQRMGTRESIGPVLLRENATCRGNTQAKERSYPVRTRVMVQNFDHCCSSTSTA